MKTIVDINDFRLLVFWVQNFLEFEHKKFTHDRLLERTLRDEPVDIRKYNIDELMIDAYDVYLKLKMANDNINMLDMFNVAQIKKEEVINETKEYFDVFQNLIENYKYEDVEMCGIQKGILNDKMIECVKIEDYENAAKYRDIIKDI